MSVVAVGWRLSEDKLVAGGTACWRKRWQQGERRQWWLTMVVERRISARERKRGEREERKWGEKERKNREENEILE